MASNPTADELLGQLFKQCMDSGLGGDVKFVDHFFSFLRRNTKLLDTKGSVERVQQVMSKHIEARKAQLATATSKPSTSSASNTSPSPNSTSSSSTISNQSSTTAPKQAAQSSSLPSDSGPKIEVLPDEEETPSASSATSDAPVGNGGKTDGYTWTQTLSEVNVVINLSSPLHSIKKQIQVEFETDRLFVKVKDAVLINGELHAKIDADESTWTLESDSKTGSTLLNIYMPKLNRMSWWSCVIKGDPTIDVKKIQPENSTLADLDPETRATVEKMMFDQRQKQLGLPSSDEEQKRAALKRFMEQHPELDFSKAKISFS